MRANLPVNTDAHVRPLPAVAGYIYVMQHHQEA